MTTADNVVDVIGFAAACLLSSSLLAQIWRVHALESAMDLSYAWQVTVGLGLLLQLLYLGHFEEWPVFAPLCCELVFMLYLFGLKLFYEQHLFGLGRAGRKADRSAQLGEYLLDSDGRSVGANNGGNGRRVDSNGAGVGRSDRFSNERLSGAENGRPAALESQQGHATAF